MMTLLSVVWLARIIAIEPEVAPDAVQSPAGSEHIAAPQPAPTAMPAAAPATPAPQPSTPVPPSRYPKVTQRKPARPIKWRLDSFLGANGARTNDDGVLAYRWSRHVPGFHLGVRMDAPLTKRLFLGGALSYSGAFASGSIDSIETTLAIHEPLVHLRLSWMTIEGVDVYGDIAGGPSFIRTEYDSDTRTSAMDTNITGTVVPRGGLTLYLPKAWTVNGQDSRFTAGLDLAMGYQYRGTVSPSATLERHDGDIRLAPTPLGDLSLSGFYWSAGIILRVI